MNWPKIRTIAFGILAGVVASAGTIAVTVAGFALSYDAIRAVGIASRIRTEWAWLLPVSVDGAMAVATIAAVVLRRMTGRTAVYPWCVVLTGAAISIACNGLHAIPPAGAELVIEERAVRFAVSAIPAVMLALSVHLLVTLVEAASVFGAEDVDRVDPVHTEPAADVEVDQEPVDPWQWSTPVQPVPVQPQPEPVQRTARTKRTTQTAPAETKPVPPRVLEMARALDLKYPGPIPGRRTVMPAMGWSSVGDAQAAINHLKAERAKGAPPVRVPDSPAELDRVAV